MKTIDRYQVTTSIEAGAARALNGGLLLNDAFYLKNFKGISNVGQRGDGNLGLKRFLAFNFKLSQVDCPLLENFLIEPFVFANGLYAVPNG